MGGGGADWPPFFPRLNAQKNMCVNVYSGETSEEVDPFYFSSDNDLKLKLFAF
jgi:hypothetical protein